MDRGSRKSVTGDKKDNERMENPVGGKKMIERSKLVDGSILEKGSYKETTIPQLGFCLTEVPVAILLEQTDGYKMGNPGERNHKRTHCLFIDDLKVYQENNLIKNN